MARMTADDLIAFEKRVIEAFTEKKVKGPVHLSGGNEAALIEIFKDIRPDDWVFSTYRNHYHALLHGVPEEWLFAEIVAGRSMNIFSAERRFVTSAIVGGCLSIAVGVAAALKLKGSERQVWVFAGDMAATTGAFHEATQYAMRQALPIQFLIEDNGMSCNSPTMETWGPHHSYKWPRRYAYIRRFPHVGIGRFVQF